jgi:hypothetical protein
MWPRSADEFSRATASKCGFVSFMQREDAADALRELQGIFFFFPTFFINSGDNFNEELQVMSWMGNRFD